MTTMTTCSSTEKAMDARALALGHGALFLAGFAAAAVGIAFEPQGYGSISILGGAFVGTASAVPFWLLLRPRRGGRGR